MAQIEGERCDFSHIRAGIFEIRPTLQAFASPLGLVL